jgi:hypothetical protein
VFTKVKAIQNMEIIRINDLKVILQRLNFIRSVKRKIESQMHDNDARVERLQRLITLNADTASDTSNTSTSSDSSSPAETKDASQSFMEESLTRALHDQEESKQRFHRLIRERDDLEVQKVEALNKTISHRNEYLSLSSMYDEELLKDMRKQHNKCDVCRWCKT